MSALGLFAALAMTAALADPTSVPTSVSTPASAPAPMADGQTEVCKTIQVTGTRFPERQCRTKADWAAMQAAARDFVNKQTTGPCTGGGCH